MAVKNYRVDDIAVKIQKAGFVPLDVLLVGATGVGKSSTLNALFGEDMAKVGEGVDPETMLVQKYRVHDYLRFWDSPGLGDGAAQDQEHAKKLTDILNKTYTHSDGVWGFIDLVMVVLDGGSRDMGTTYRLLEQVILKNIAPGRVLVVVNQADMAMSGRYWDSSAHCPQGELRDFLEEKTASVQKRLLEATGMKIQTPVYYSATENYRLDKVMDAIINHIPKTKRNIKEGVKKKIIEIVNQRLSEDLSLFRLDKEIVEEAVEESFGELVKQGLPFDHHSFVEKAVEKAKKKAIEKAIGSRVGVFHSSILSFFK